MVAKADKIRKFFALGNKNQQTTEPILSGVNHMPNLVRFAMRISIAVFALCLALTIPVNGQKTAFQLPPFLPEYYTPVFEIDGARLFPVDNKEINGMKQFVYSTQDQRYTLSIERIQCERPHCLALFDKLQGYLNTEVNGRGGTVLEITSSEISAQIFREGTEETIFSFVLPGSIVIWKYTAPKEDTHIVNMFKTIKSFTDRQRYEQSFDDNVAMGHWGPQIHDYARQLMREGQKQEAVRILRGLVATSPYNYAAHMDLAETTTDAKEARNSASVVFKNSEDPGLILKADRLLSGREPSPEVIPFLSSKDSGLQLILVPLSPCSIQFLREAASTYEQITKIPVKIRKLHADLPLRSPDRIFRQRDIQMFLAQQTKGKLDFQGWDKQRYMRALKEVAGSQNPISHYHIRKLIDTIDKGKGQYEAEPYLNWFCRELKKYRSSDPRTMYVGVTELDIFSGDTNFVFSLHESTPGLQASILSYNMMLSRTLSEEYESRQRLIERIAKELVPASLKTLGIPRSTDPRCPYSYSSGVKRLDQKGLILSERVQEEINRFR